MVILRPTRKLHALLPPAGAVLNPSDTALGDWYVNRLIVDRQPLLLLVSAASLLPMLIPARDVRRLPERLAWLVGQRLQRSGVDTLVIGAETRAMGEVVVAPTIDRSVLGIMVDFAKAVSNYLEPGRWSEAALPEVEARLAETPCHASRAFDRVVFPDRKAPELLNAKWAAWTIH
jgi:hypothetical protein